MLRIPSFEEFANHFLADSGDPLIVGREEPYLLEYIPFEHVSVDAKLVIVGITPGPNQVKLAYKRASELLSAGATEEFVLREVKKVGAFGGPTLRPNLVRMLNHFRINELLGVRDAEEFWGESDHLLHTTSIVPHAAFKNDKPFNGSFSEIIRTDLLGKCFRAYLIPELKQLPPSAKYIALGRTVLEALTWCVANGFLNSDQLLGEFPHPSTRAGNQVGYFLREIPRDALKPKNPVTARCNWLDGAYVRMSAAVKRWNRTDGRRVIRTSKELPRFSDDAETKPPVPVTSVSPTAKNLEYVVRRGRGKGTILTPHKYQNGAFVVSKTRCQADYVYVADEGELIHWLRSGFSLRMSNQNSDTHRSPSLISPRQLGIEEGQ